MCECAEHEHMSVSTPSQVEYLSDGVWKIQRDAPIYIEQGSEVSVGVMTAAPQNKEGTPAMEAMFKNIKIQTLE